MEFKAKIILSISGLLLGVSIISSVLNYRLDVQHTQKQLHEISLPLSLDNIYTEIQRRMIEPLVISSMMANDTFVQEWLESGEQKLSSINRYLKKVRTKYGVFNTFLVSDATKNYYHSKGLTDNTIIDKVSANHESDAWYFNFKKSKELYEVNLDIDSHYSKSLIMFINYKVLSTANKLLGVTGIGLRLLDIQSMLESFKEHYHYDVYFVDKEGKIILHTESLNKHGNIANISGLKELKAEIFANKNHQFEYNYKNNEYLLSTKYVSQLKLYLLVEINKEVYMHNLKQKFYMNLSISLFITLLVTLVILYIINIYQKKLELLANEDPLTGLANRRVFNERIEHFFNLYYRKNIHSLRLVLIDIDDFKVINDTFGHLSGDAVLMRLSKILMNKFRKTDLVIRWGGEEFAILLVDTSEEVAEKFIVELQNEIREDSELKEIIDKPLTISLGIGELNTKESLDALITKVDEALYEAKETGKDKYVVAS